jgi:predicted nucleic acid-binding protein
VVPTIAQAQTRHRSPAERLVDHLLHRTQREAVSRDQAHSIDVVAELRAAYLANERAADAHANRMSMMTDDQVRARLGLD